MIPRVNQVFGALMLPLRFAINTSLGPALSHLFAFIRKRVIPVSAFARLKGANQAFVTYLTRILHKGGSECMGEGSQPMTCVVSFNDILAALRSWREDAAFGAREWAAHVMEVMSAALAYLRQHAVTVAAHAKSHAGHAASFAKAHAGHAFSAARSLPPQVALAYAVGVCAVLVALYCSGAASGAWTLFRRAFSSATGFGRSAAAQAPDAHNSVGHAAAARIRKTGRGTKARVAAPARPPKELAEVAALNREALDAKAVTASHHGHLSVDCLEDARRLVAHRSSALAAEFHAYARSCAPHLVGPDGRPPSKAAVLRHLAEPSSHARTSRR
jgi:hypothetical protein